MKKIRVFLLCLALALLVSLSAALMTGCDGDAGDTNTDGASDTRGERGSATDSDVVMNKSLGMFAVSVATDDEYIADATVRKQGDGISVKVYSDGTASLTVSDWWGNTATVEVVVEGSKISALNVTPLSGNVANVVFFGANPDDSGDDTESIQKAIDSLRATGGTVYFPAGRYLAGNLVMREGVDLELQGKVEDVGAGYTNELAKRIADGEFAVIENNFKGQLFLNLEVGEKGTTAVGDFSIRGGMVDFGAALPQKAQVDVNQDMKNFAGKAIGSTGGVILVCASDVTFDNVIFKDAYNSHAFQIAGMSDVTIKDCMFAGYTCRADTKGSASSVNVTRETIQIEYTHSGAMPGAAAFEEGEFYYCENIAITGCYFGDSDTAAYHLTPIGQHGLNGTANVNFLEISDCVFDNPYRAAMRFPNYTNVTIKNNKFIHDTQGFGLDPSLIDLYTETGDKTYAGQTKNGFKTTVYSAFGFSHDGLHNIDIIDNEFIIGASSNMRAVKIVGTTYNYGATTVTSKILRVDGEIYGASYTGYVPCSNTVSDVTFTGNTINLSSAKYKDNVVRFSYVDGLTVSGNTVKLSGSASLSASYGGTKGIQATNITDGKKVTVTSTLTGKYVTLDNGIGGTIKLGAASSAKRTITLNEVDGAEILLDTDAGGNLIVKVVCEDGKTFAGWTGSDGKTYSPSGTVSLSSDLSLTVKLK